MKSIILKFVLIR